MISVIVYGRDDSHGYNLPKRAGLPLQAETWGLPKEKIEEVRLTEKHAGRYVKVLERPLPGLPVPMLKSAATPSPEFVVTCARLGRMLNCTEALSEAELVSATKALGSVFTAENPKDYIERSRCLFPRALLPLLSLYLAEAWKIGNEPLAAAMEQIYGLLTAPREGAEPRSTVPVREPAEMPASKPDFLLRQSIGRAINRPGPLSRQELVSARQSVTELLGARHLSSYLLENRARIHPATLPLLFHDRAEAERSGNVLLAQKLQNIYWGIQLEADDEAPWQTSDWSESVVDSGWFAERTAVAGQKARQTFPLYLFVHLPKTAGTTFLGSVIPRVFQEGEAFVLRGDAVQNRADLHLLNTLTSEKFNQLKFIGGHFADLLSNFQGREVQRITLLREPVERCLSGYFHAMYHESTTPKWESFRKEKLCFSGFVERYQADNFHSFERLFSPEVDAEENCSRVLRQFSLVGLTEKFPEFLFLLHSLHGWKLALFENRLVRQEKKGFSLSAEDRASVRARDDLFWMFRREFELYERATKQFEALWNREVEGNRLVEFETYKTFLEDYQRICAALSPNHDEARKISGQFETWLKDVSSSTPAPLLAEKRTL